MAESLKTWQTLIPSLSEAQRRWYVGQKALELGRGGIEQIHGPHGIILYARVPNPPEEAKITTYFFTNPNNSLNRMPLNYAAVRGKLGGGAG
jgi:hypothetical protein